MGRPPSCQKYRNRINYHLRATILLRHALKFSTAGYKCGSEGIRHYRASEVVELFGNTWHGRSIHEYSVASCGGNSVWLSCINYLTSKVYTIETRNTTPTRNAGRAKINKAYCCGKRYSITTRVFRKGAKTLGVRVISPCFSTFLGL